MKNSRRANNEGSVFKLNNGKWRAQVSVGKDQYGKYKYKAYTANTQKEAVEWLKNYKVNNNYCTNTEYQNMNFDEYLCYWFNTLVNSGEHKPSSLDRIESTCNTHIIPAIGKYK